MHVKNSAHDFRQSLVYAYVASLTGAALMVVVIHMRYLAISSEDI